MPATSPSASVTFVAVDGIDVDIHRGEAFGFLGPNGAGKSSTMRMVGCVSPPTRGRCSCSGSTPARHGPAIRARLGVVPQEDTLDQELRVRENLVIYGRYFGLSRSEVRARADRLLDFVQLGDRADSKVEPLSGGMKRRLTIARSLINEPEMLLLDEPTTGLDPQARHVVWERLFRLKQQGVTLVLTTHYMDEAEQLCDRLVVMDGGRIAAEGSPSRAHRRRTPPARSSSCASGHDQQLHVAALRRASPTGSRSCPTGCCCTSTTATRPSPPCSTVACTRRSVLVRRSTLEDVFLRLTGRTLVD